MTLRIKNIRMQIVLGMMSLIALIIAASLLGFAFFSRHKLRQMVLERAINQVTATVRYAEYILQNVPDYIERPQNGDRYRRQRNAKRTSAFSDDFPTNRRGQNAGSNDEVHHA